MARAPKTDEISDDLLRDLIADCRDALDRDKKAVTESLVTALEELSSLRLQAKPAGALESLTRAAAGAKERAKVLEQTIAAFEDVTEAQISLERLNRKMAAVEKAQKELAEMKEDGTGAAGEDDLSRVEKLRRELSADIEPPASEPPEPEPEPSARPASAKREEAAGEPGVAALPRDLFDQSPREEPQPLEPRELGEGVVDLQQAMVERLRTQADRLRQERDSLVINSRNNLATTIRVHQAILGLLTAKSFESFIQQITEDLGGFLGLVAVSLCVEGSGRGSVVRQAKEIRILREGRIGEIFGEHKQLLLRDECDGDEEIYGEKAVLVRSDALLRLRISSKTPPAMIAFGSEEPGHFEDAQGTELLTFLAQSIELLTRAWLDLPE